MSKTIFINRRNGLLLALLMAVTSYYLSRLISTGLKHPSSIHQGVEGSDPGIEIAFDPIDDCPPLLLSNHDPIPAETAVLVKWLGGNYPVRPGLGSSTSRHLVEVADERLNSSEDSTGTGLPVIVNASIDVKGGVLSLLADGRKFPGSISGLNADAWRGGFGFPTMVITDATGLGAGWHLNIRSAEGEADFSFLHCLKLALPADGIVTISGDISTAVMFTSF